MARAGIDSALLAQLAAKTVGLVFLLEGFFSSGPFRLWTGIGALSWNGFTWTGAGNLLGIGQMQETGDVKAVGLTISLSGVPTSTIATALSDLRTGQLVNAYIAPYDFQVGALLATPYPFFTGRVDVPTITDAADTATVALLIENRLVDFERERVRFFDTQTQIGYFPGDRGFDYVAALQDQKIFWGISN